MFNFLALYGTWQGKLKAFEFHIYFLVLICFPQALLELHVNFSFKEREKSFSSSSFHKIRQVCKKPFLGRRALLSLSQAAILVLLCLQMVMSAQSSNSSTSANTSLTGCRDDGGNIKFTCAVNLDVSRLTNGETPKPWLIPRSSQLSIPCNESNLSPRQCHRAVYTQEGAAEVCRWQLQLFGRVL